ncbi:MAG: FAD:protein FMN transferase [Deltaproteobacteria bacterium]|nr:FAD:protein FMN transferase [Deltaproteobacteria bacterium]MBW2419680.1 FAD:protein FMN transferase [Deltaproteobacteria bacterium]
MTSSTDPRHRARALALPIVALIAAACSSTAPTAPFSLVSDGRPLMGTVLELSVVARDAAAAREWIADAFEEVGRLEALLSRFDAESDVSRLGRAAGQGSLSVDPATRDLLDRALKGSALTGGAFDPTVGPLIELWERTAREGRVPAPRELEAARERVGAQLVRLPSEASAELRRAGMSIDLGGIAKGYALDRLATSLREAGAKGALLSFGQSSAWALGSPPDAPRWKLLLRAPSGGWAGVVELRDQAMSMSSSLGQWSEIEGRRYGHVVDPRSGRLLERGIEAAVVGPDATWAEILSTALLVLAEGDGLALMERLEGCEAMLIDAEGRVAMTSGWESATRFRGVDLPAQ